MSAEPLTYRDLELEVSNYQDDGNFQVRVLKSPAGGMTPSEAVASRFEATATAGERQSEKTIQSLLRRLGSRKANLAEMMALGSHLAEILLPGKVGELYRQSRAAQKENEGLRLRLRIEPRELSNLPWELLYVQTSPGEPRPTDFLAWQREVSITRYETIGKSGQAADPTAKIRLAMVLASPEGLDELDLEKEEAAILQAITDANADGEIIEVVSLGSQADDAPSDMRDSLPDVIRGAHIFHFAGHGLFEEGDEGRILLEDADGYPDGFEASKLAALLGNESVQLAVLGTCDGGRRDGVNHWTGVAPALVRERVPAVVAMQDSIRDRNATAFDASLYTGLLAGYTIDEAVFAGRQRIITNAKNEKERDWVMPVLYLLDEDGILFPLPEEPHEAAAGSPLQVRMDIQSNFGEVTGDVSLESTVNQIETNIAQGDYVSRDVIVNNILVLGNGKALDEILKSLMDSQGVDAESLRNPGALVVPKNIGDQITELFAVQKEVEAQGISTSPQALYRLGMLAAYRREYASSLSYFRQATQADPEYSRAFQAIAWLQQSLAMDDMQKRNYDDAIDRLADARRASAQTDPLDPQALALRGYISKTLAQIAEVRGKPSDQVKFNMEAARFFSHAVQMDPNNASAHNGLGNVEQALSNIDDAISAYKHAIQLVPKYTAAHHDLASALESKIKSDPDNAAGWCQAALRSWKETYRLAPDDPGFTADYIATIGQRISWLEQQCG